MKSKRVATFGVLVALAFIFSYIESLVAFSGLIPGMKVGLANIVIVLALYKLGEKEAFFISFVRIVLVGFTFGNMSTMLYSMAGGILSFLAMCIAKRTKLFSIVGVSILGAIFHNIGQIVIAIWMLESSVLVHYLPLLLLSGLITGIVIGIVGGELKKRVEGIGC